MYLSFSPYYSGLSNVIMSYELAFGLAMITNRTIILPRNTWILFVSESQPDKTKWNDIWELFDKDLAKQYVNLIEFDDVPEFANIKDKMETVKSYTGNIYNELKDLFLWKSMRTTIADDHNVFLNDLHAFIKDEDFLNFSNKRRVDDLNRDEKFIHFENCLFGHYWYQIYPGGPQVRNRFKDKINSIFRYKNYFYEIAKQVRDVIGPYNSVHIRRSDFLHVRQDKIKTIISSDGLLEAIERVFPKDIPLYISTDETDKSFFDKVKGQYKVYFFDDFDYQVNALVKVALEQCICFHSEFFYGTHLSTYTKRINIMRGLEGKQAADYAGINSIQTENLVEVYKHYPWYYKPGKMWFWDQSSYLQWIRE